MGRAEFGGHGISYCVLGSGPSLVLVKPHRGARVYDFAAWLAARYTVIQIEPLGYGWSDRPQHHPPGDIHAQIHAVLDAEGIDRFVVWGYSAGGAMAMAVARESLRVTAMVCGGCSPADRVSEAVLRRMDREQRPAISQRQFWRWHSGINWLEELATIKVPKLVYVGSEDGPRVGGPRGVTRTRSDLVAQGVTVLEFGGLDHATCMSEPAFSARVGPAVTQWLDGAGVH